MPKKKMYHLPNGYGSIKHLSGNRRKPWAVMVNPHINDAGSYSYDLLGTYAEKSEALIALADYNKNPVDITNKNITFAELFELFYQDKYNSKRKFSDSTIKSTKTAYNNTKSLHHRKFGDLRHQDLQKVVDNCPLKHASLELIVSLYHQMYEFAIKNDIVDKDVSLYVTINVPDDDEHGIRFEDKDITTLWEHTDDPDVMMILIYIYTGWRATELAELPKTAISLEDMTMTGGKKTAAGKNRIVPIHPRIQNLVRFFYEQPGDYLFTSCVKPTTYHIIRRKFADVLKKYALTQPYTLHDCRHTFASWLSDIGTPEVIQDRLMGHSSKSLDNKVYVHKTVEHLREWVYKLL